MKTIRLLMTALMLAGMGSAVEAFKIGPTSGRGQAQAVQTTTVDTRSMAEPVKKPEAVKTESPKPPMVPPRDSKFLAPGASATWIEKTPADVQRLANDYLVPIVDKSTALPKIALERRTIGASDLNKYVTTLATTYHPTVLAFRNGDQATIDFMKQVFPEQTTSKSGLLYQFLTGYVSGLTPGWVGSKDEYNALLNGLDDRIIKAGVSNYLPAYKPEGYTTKTGISGFLARGVRNVYEFNEHNVTVRADRDAALIYKTVLIERFGDQRSAKDKRRLAEQTAPDYVSTYSDNPFGSSSGSRAASSASSASSESSGPAEAPSEEEIGSAEAPLEEEMPSTMSSASSASSESSGSAAPSESASGSSEREQAYQEANANMGPGGQHEYR